MGYLSPKLSYMNLKAKLESREFEVLECIAWGASQKETASFSWHSTSNRRQHGSENQVKDGPTKSCRALSLFLLHPIQHII